MRILPARSIRSKCIICRRLCYCRDRNISPHTSSKGCLLIMFYEIVDISRSWSRSDGVCCSETSNPKHNPQQQPSSQYIHSAQAPPDKTSIARYCKREIAWISRPPHKPDEGMLTHANVTAIRSAHSPALPDLPLADTERRHSVQSGTENRRCGGERSVIW